MWARVHKVDRIRPRPDGTAVVLVEDERTRANMERVPSLSTTVGIARVLNARRALDAKFGGKGEVRYASTATLPSFLYDAVIRAGASVADATGERVLSPAQTASVSAVIDAAFADLAHYTRNNIGAPDMISALKRICADRVKQPLDREKDANRYWQSAFEVAALIGELWRPRGGRWIETKDMPVPFAVKLGTSNDLASPASVAMRVVEGEDVSASLPAPPPTP